MKLNTDEPGLRALMKPYKAALLLKLYKETDTDSHIGALGSGFLWVWLETNAERLGVKSMSRASVINGLNDLVDLGFLKWRDATGKGGHHKRYSVKLNPEDFEEGVKNLFTDKLDSVFKRDWWRLN